MIKKILRSIVMRLPLAVGIRAERISSIPICCQL